MRFNKFSGAVIVLGFLAVIAQITIIGFILYAAHHFVMKYW